MYSACKSPFLSLLYLMVIDLFVSHIPSLSYMYIHACMIAVLHDVHDM